MVQKAATVDEADIPVVLIDGVRSRLRFTCLKKNSSVLDMTMAHLLDPTESKTGLADLGWAAVLHSWQQIFIVSTAKSSQDGSRSVSSCFMSFDVAQKD